MKWEGFVPKAEPDPAGIPTWCYGETEKKLSADPAYIYSKGECAILLRERMARDYAPRIANCLPEIVHNRFIFGVLIDASYNAGWAAVCRSPMAANVRAGQLKSACEALPSWYVGSRYRGPTKSAEFMRRNGWRWTGKSWFKTFRGLVNRRNDEKRVCLQGLA